jgi:YD repeat-containing protein
MGRLIIRHETAYAYESPVGFAPHRLLLRPRDSHSVRLLDARLTLAPPGETRWVYDALGNCVCWFTPRGQARELSVVSELFIERFPAPLAPLPVRDPHTAMPVVYEPVDRAVLAPFMEPVTADAEGVLLGWVRDHLGRADETALDFLLRFNRAIHDEFTYRPRDEGAALEPADTVAAGSGTCRDFAWLMVEALRRVGYAARFVTGYLFSPGEAERRGSGATHAWCQVFLPDLGWMEFDPTNGLAESAELIPVAVARTPPEAAPVLGAVIGDPGAAQMRVHVDVQLADSLPAAA